MSMYTRGADSLCLHITQTRPLNSSQLVQSYICVGGGSTGAFSPHEMSDTLMELKKLLGKGGVEIFVQL